MKYVVPVTLALGLVLAFFQNIAIDRSWYYIYWWFDIPMHILGGAVIALVVVYIHHLVDATAPKLGVRAIVLSVLCIGIVWEVYEYVIDIMYTHLGWDPIDTGKDLIDDVIGATIVARLLRKK